MTKTSNWGIMLAITAAFLVGAAIPGNVISDQVAEAAGGWKPFTVCPAGLTQAGSWCIDPIAAAPLPWVGAAAACSGIGLELVPAGILAQAAIGGFATVPSGATVWTSNIGDDPAIAGSGDDAILITMVPSAIMHEAGVTGSGSYLCGKPLLV